MRTTLTLDPDVAARLERMTKERSISFKEAVNATLRAGFDAEPAARPAPYVLPTFEMGVRPGIDLDRTRHLDADLEDEETVRRLSLRK